MKIKFFLLAALLNIFTFSLSARTIGLREAENVARNFLYMTINKYGDGCSMSDISLSDPYVHHSGQHPVFFAFQTNPGFVIVSAEDGFTPILGYSYEGRFEFEQAPAHYKGFILNYVEQLDFVRENQLAPSAEVAQLWEELRQADIQAVTFNRERDVEPLLNSLWDQGSPYNILCPEDPAGPGGHVWAGCVATAMAQIMYYWRYPESGTGQHCYIPGNYSYGQQCANFGETYYQWEGMKNGIDNRNPIPNAELQYHCAVSVNMNFSPNGSGSYSYLVPDRLNQYFRYNNAQYKEKQNYSSSGWISLLKADIDQGYPLYYSGYNPDQGGHAFVCDGYQGDNFNFNFGWSGSGNGYYTLSNVGDFYQGQACVRNFVPSDADYPYFATDTLLVTAKSGSITDGSGPVQNYPDNNTAYWLIDPQTQYDSITSITLSFSGFDLLPGDTLRVYDGGSTSDAMLGSFSGNSLPSQLTSSSNKMMIHFTSDGSGNATGFYAEYSTTSPTWCTGLTQLTGPSGTFDDGSGDFYYQSGATCMWRIKPDDGGNIILNFNYFDTEEDYDNLTIYDGTTLLGTYSGAQMPPQLTATSGLMFITWHTSDANNFPGWEAYYETDVVGVEELPDAFKGFSVYPNPTSSILHVTFTMPENGQVSLSLSNPAGQAVLHLQSAGIAGQNDYHFDTAELTPGLYFLRISSDKGSMNKKVVVR